MPSAQRTEVFDITPEPFYRVVIDYTSYPEFVANVTRIQILQGGEDHVRAKFFLHVVKDFNYTLDLYHEPPHRVHWKLVRGDYFKRLDGAWDLKPKGKRKTEVTYTADVEAKILVPDFLVRTLVGSSLPSMMRAFYHRARSLRDAEE